MQWRDEWRQLSMRLNSWRSVAETLLANPGLIADWNQFKPVTELLVGDAQQLATRIRGLALPEPYKTHVRKALKRIDQFSRVVEGSNGVMHQLLFLEALRAPVDEAYLATDERRRSLVDRALVPGSAKGRRAAPRSGRAERRRSDPKEESSMNH